MTVWKDYQIVEKSDCTTNYIVALNAVDVLWSTKGEWNVLVRHKKLGGVDTR